MVVRASRRQGPLLLLLDSLQLATLALTLLSEILIRTIICDRDAARKLSSFSLSRNPLYSIKQASPPSQPTSPPLPTPLPFPLPLLYIMSVPANMVIVSKPFRSRFELVRTERLKQRADFRFPPPLLPLPVWSNSRTTLLLL